MAAPISITSPLPAADLLFESMIAKEGLSRLGEMQLQLLSARPDLQAEDLLGLPLTVGTELRDGTQRWLNGYVTRFGINGHRGSYYAYSATVRPWLWFLTRTADCRIFQDLTVPDIVAQVFADHPVAAFDFRLFRSYRRWTYCVQYRESDHNFVARLLEHEGIYWYFEHQLGQHTLVLVDSASSHDAAPGLASLPYVEDPASVNPDTDYVSGWRFSKGVTTGRAAQSSYDFERPSVGLDTAAALARQYKLSDYEVFDWQGDYTMKPDGQQWTDDRLDEFQTGFESLHGSSNAHGIEVGRLLGLTRHPRDDQNAEYLVTASSITAQVTAYESGDGAGDFQCEFEAIPSKQQFRPPRTTRKPFVQGPQSAVVTGPAGEEIFTDAYGRVKLQFHWDRLAQGDDKSSCWVRVSHPWAGKNFGAIHIPRAGQEVIVDFLEGDPDQPIVTGRVYNAEQMPPWELPANATQSGILTRSSKGGAYANANAIRFEDKTGAEQLWVHAERNQDIEVEHDETHWVGNDRTKTVDHDETVHVKHDRTETVDHDETITIGVDRVETVGANESITIGASRIEAVGSSETISIGAARTEVVGANESITIGANRTISVGGSETATVALQRTHAVGVNETITIGAAQELAIGAFQAVAVGAYQTVTVGGYQTVTVGAAQSISVGANQSLAVGGSVDENVAGNQMQSIGGALNVSVAKDTEIDVGKNLNLVAAEQVVIKTGDASIVMKKDGSILIKGKDIKLEASGDIVEKASGDLVLKGSSKVAIN